MINDKINELIAKASKASKASEATSDVFDKRLFAELIIKECVDILKTKQSDYENPGSYECDSYYQQCRAKANAYEEAASMINYHFGIKS